LIGPLSLWIYALRRKHRPETTSEATRLGKRRQALQQTALSTGAPDELAYLLRELMGLCTTMTCLTRAARRASARAGCAHRGGWERAGAVSMAGELLIQVRVTQWKKRRKATQALFDTPPAPPQNGRWAGAVIGHAAAPPSSATNCHCLN
jgi:hypothetical protein